MKAMKCSHMLTAFLPLVLCMAMMWMTMRSLGGNRGYT